MADQNDIQEDEKFRSHEPIPDGVRWFREHSIPIVKAPHPFAFRIHLDNNNDGR